MAAELQKRSSPNRAFSFIGVHSKMMRFVGDGQQKVLVPAAELGFQGLLLASCTLVAEQPSVRGV